MEDRMKLGIMQPYYLPYLGYFQLMTAVDLFIYYDDVNFIKGGWINRNNIRINGLDHLFTLELKGASSFKKINEIEIGRNRGKLLKTFVQAYSKAPYFNDVNPLLYDIFEHQGRNLFQYMVDTHQLLFNYLGIKINYRVSSLIDKDNSLKGQDKVIDICKRIGATTYINAIGGKKLYSTDAFKKEGIELRFIQSGDIPHRSIIDVLMWNSIEEVRDMLNDYTI